MSTLREEGRTYTLASVPLPFLEKCNGTGHLIIYIYAILPGAIGPKAKSFRNCHHLNELIPLIFVINYLTILLFFSFLPITVRVW